MEHWNIGSCKKKKGLFYLSNPSFHHSLPTGGQA